MSQHTPGDVLVKLSDTHLMLSDPEQDIRDRTVIDQNGDEIGHVSGLFIDPGEKKVRVLEVAAGGFLGLGERHFLVPVEAVSGVTQDEVRIDQTREHVANSPAYDPTLTEMQTRDYLAAQYGHYGYPPYWDGGPVNPGLGYPII